MVKFAVLYMCLLVQGFCVIDKINYPFSQANVSQAGSSLRDPQILFDSYGNGIAFWMDATGDLGYCAFLPFGSNTWSSQIRLVGLAGVTKNQPIAVINANNQGVVSWESKNGSTNPSDLYAIRFFTTKNGITLGNTLQVSLAGQKCSKPALSIDSSNRVLISWINEAASTNNEVWTAFSQNFNASWSQQTKVASSVDSIAHSLDQLAVDVNSSGKGTLVWRDELLGNNHQLYSINFSLSNVGMTFQTVLKLPSNLSQNHGNVSVDAVGNAFCSWSTKKMPVTPWEIQYSTLAHNASSWSSLGVFQASSNAQSNNKQSMNSSGFGVVAWQEDTGLNDDSSNAVAAYMMTFQMIPTGVVTVAPSAIQLPNGKTTPNVFIDKRNNVVVSWHNEKANPYYVQLGFLPSGSNAIQIEQVSTNSVDGGESAPIYFNNGNANGSFYGGVIWTNQTGTFIQAVPLVTYNPVSSLQKNDLLYNPAKYQFGGP